MLSTAKATALRNKHNLLSKQIEFEEKRPAINRGLIVTLKRERLAIKDQLAQSQSKVSDKTSFG